MMYANFLNKPLFWGVPTDHEGYYTAKVGHKSQLIGLMLYPFKQYSNVVKSNSLI